MHQIAVICGSLRKASTNAGLLRSIIGAQDKRFKFEWVDISGFPVFNEDIEVKGIPADVQVARDIVGKADAILFGVPEYNYSIASPMKNAYDWLSRDDKNKYCPVTNKLGAFVSSGASRGGGNAQDHFRQSVIFRKLQILKPSNEAEFLVKRFSGKFFDDNGNLIDESTKKRVPLFLNEF